MVNFSHLTPRPDQNRAPSGWIGQGQV